MSKTVSVVISSTSSITHQAVMGPADLPWQKSREVDGIEAKNSDSSSPPPK